MSSEPRKSGPVLLEFSVSPLGVGTSVGKQVAKCVEIIDASGLDYQLHAMGTVVEGDLDETLALLKKCIEETANTCERVSCVAKIDFRSGGSGRLKAKVDSVAQQMSKPPKTSA